MENKKRVFLLEDDKETASAMVQILKHYGYTVTPFTDPNNLLQEDIASSFDVGIIDVMLPNTDGFLVLKQLKEKHQDTKLQYILITANPTKEVQAKATEESVALLIKPFSPKKLAELIEQTS